MDQGLAAALAGVAGLVGAAIGGLATAYGARVGAQKSIEAAQVQVDRQAAAEYQQWVRDQRRQLCSAISDAWGPFRHTASSCITEVKDRRPLSDAELGTLNTHYVTLSNACGRLALWGPEQLITTGNELAKAALAVYDQAAHWPAVLSQGDGSIIRDHQLGTEANRTRLGQAYRHFTSQARSLLSGSF
jgi:hypothetical protein